MARLRIESLIPIVKYSVIFGLAPSYNFKNHRLTYKKLFRFYSLSLACAMSTISFVDLYLRLVVIYHNSCSSIFCLLTFLLELMGLATFLASTLNASFWNRNTWQELIHLMSSLENAMLKKQHLRIPNFTFLLVNVWCLIYYTGQRLFLSNYMKYYSSILIILYVEFVLVHLALNIIVNIKHKYSDINDLLLTVDSTCRGNDVSKILGKVMEHYLLASQIVGKFNAIFGWPILGLLSHSVVNLVNFLLIFSGSVMSKGHEEPSQLLTLSAMYGISILYGPVTLILSCDSAARESRKLLVGCLKVERFVSVDTREGEQLIQLENLIKNRCPAFTAAGFFRIDRSTLLSLFSTVTTYFIVTIQLNKYSYKDINLEVDY